MPRISSSPVKVVLMIAVLVIGATVGIFYLVTSSKAKAEKASVKAAARQRPAANAPATASKVVTKVLIPRFDGFTRCEPRIDFEFELDTQGDPISLKFPGVDTPLEYSGKGTITAPTNRLSGPVIITSLAQGKQTRVRIWEVVYLSGQR